MKEVLETVSAIGEKLAQDKGLAWEVEVAEDTCRECGETGRVSGRSS